jgi:hypothetical protein
MAAPVILAISDSLLEPPFPTRGSPRWSPYTILPILDVALLDQSLIFFAIRNQLESAKLRPSTGKIVSPTGACLEKSLTANSW